MGLPPRSQGYVQQGTGSHLRLGTVQERRAQYPAGQLDRDVPGIRLQDQERRIDERIFAGGKPEGDVEEAIGVQVRPEPGTGMEHLTEDALDLAAVLLQVGNDDTNLEGRGSSGWLVFKGAARPFGGSADFTTGVGQAHAYGITHGIRVLAFPHFHTAAYESIDQPLLGRRPFMETRELDFFGDRDFSPLDEVREHRGQFRVRKPALLAAAPSELPCPRLEGPGIRGVLPFRGVKRQMPAMQEVPGPKCRLGGRGDVQQRVSGL